MKILPNNWLHRTVKIYDIDYIGTIVDQNEYNFLIEWTDNFSIHRRWYCKDDIKSFNKKVK